MAAGELLEPIAFWAELEYLKLHGIDTTGRLMLDRDK